MTDASSRHRAPAADDTTALAPVLVTGGHGFAGRHLVAHLASASAPARRELELLDPAAVAAAVEQAQPRTVFHLAAFSSPRRSLDHPEEALVGNVRMTLNVLEAVRAHAPAATVVLIGSGQVYGEPGAGPIDEDSPLAPRNPYAVSKATSDLLGLQYELAHGLRVIRARPFNHAGPGQSDEFVLGTLTRQVAEAELAGVGEAVLRTGDTTVGRDFTDVRDVVRAYALLAGAPAGAYNICSGRCTTIAELLDDLRAQARVRIRHEVDPARLRADDPPELRGSSARLTAATGWRPSIDLHTTVGDALKHWREQLAR